jgi:GTPase SAR1 family protein
MTIDHHLIKKIYYETFLDENPDAQPIQVLGEAYMSEQQNELPDLSYIRFAQGELYFQYKDYEAAIFKWENISNELEPWAKKNMADAYYELGILSSAEDLYQSIETDNLTLKTEVALQLFSLYIERGKNDSAVNVIKKTVSLNPDYPNVTEIARTYFEEQQDWKHAIELAINEAIRSEAVNWFDYIKTYVDQGVTKTLDPAYFSEALFVLYRLDQSRFEKLVCSIWHSFKKENTYLAWLTEVNQLFINLEPCIWAELSNIFKETYFDLIDGKYPIKKIHDLMPFLLTNWLQITDQQDAIVASTAILSWNELFPASISIPVIEEAETLFHHGTKNTDVLSDCLQLFDLIMQWAEVHELGANHRIKWMVEKLMDFDTQHFLVLGQNGSGKSSFIQFILGEEILQDAPTSSVVIYKDDIVSAIEEITDEGVVGLSGLADFQERMERRRNALESMIEFSKPNSFLHDHQLALIDTPGLNGYLDRQSIFKYLHIADTILFMLDANRPFTDLERTILSQIYEMAPDVPIHFVLNKMDTIFNEQEAIRIFDETKSTINTYLPDAKIFAFSSQYDQTLQLNDLSEFVHSIMNTREREEKRTAKLLAFMRNTITNLLQKRRDIENHLIETVKWNEEMVMKLNGAENQLHDLELQKTKAITRSYRSIKESIQTEMTDVIPKMLRDCAKLIREDSNFSKIHLELNAEMNRRIQDYLENNVLPKYFGSLQDWINQSNEELLHGQAFLDEIGEGFNALYGEERMNLECDLKTLDDWRRDTDRMTSGVQLEEINIFLRKTPTQLLLKSAGKIFGALSQNKPMLYNKYKSFVENEDYAEATEMVMNRFFQQFELFERSLERDISWIFRNSINVLNHAVEDAQLEIQTNEDMVKKMNTNPEMFRDPLTLFEVRLRQLEWMNLVGEGVQEF